MSRLARRWSKWTECEGHPASLSGPGGETDFCDGSCKRRGVALCAACGGVITEACRNSECEPLRVQ